MNQSTPTQTAPPSTSDLVTVLEEELTAGLHLAFQDLDRFRTSENATEAALGTLRSTIELFQIFLDITQIMAREAELGLSSFADYYNTLMQLFREDEGDEEGYRRLEAFWSVF